MLRSFRFLALLLCFLFLFVSCGDETPTETSAEGVELTNEKSEMMQTESAQIINDTLSESTSEREISEEEEKALAKLSFCLDENEYRVIDSFSELVQAIRGARDYSASCFLEHLTLTASIAGGNIGNDEGYLQLMRERETVSTAEEVRAFREKLNEYSKEFHERIFRENVDAFAVIGYSEISHMGYSPYVMLTVPVENMTVDALLALAKSDRIGVISVSVEGEAVDEEIDVPVDE